jgi:hypothetical protein
LLNNRALCFSTSVNSVCSSDSEKFGLLFPLILVQKYRTVTYKIMDRNKVTFNL